MQELRTRMAVAWRCAPAGQKLLAVTVLLVLLGGVFVAAHGGPGSAANPVARAAATVAQPASAVPTQPAVSPQPTAVPTVTAPSPSVSVAPSSAAPSGTELETASAPDSAAAQACATYRTAVEPIVRQAVDNDDINPALALIRAGSDPQSPWSRLTSAATLASMRSPQLQQHITMLGKDISDADPSLSLTGLGSDLDAIDMDCGDAPG